jgi:hypothetical protein
MREIQAVGKHSKARPAARHVLTWIAVHCNHARGDWIAWPSYDTLAAETGFSAGHVYRLIRELKKAGELGIVQGGGRGIPNTYEILLPGNPNTDVDLSDDEKVTPYVGVFEKNGRTGAEKPEHIEAETLSSEPLNPNMDVQGTGSALEPDDLLNRKEPGALPRAGDENHQGQGDPEPEPDGAPPHPKAVARERPATPEEIAEAMRPFHEAGSP